ncbi:hypothetical protein ISCGN_010967 [Ixodes scapularis]
MHRPPNRYCGSSTPKCINCTGAHPAYSRSCPKFKEEKEILTLKTKENLSYHEARKRFSFLQGGTYAEAAVRGTRSLSKASVGTQYSLRDTECPPSPLTPTETPVGSQTPEAPQKLTKSKACPQRLAPKVRVVLDPTRSQVRKGSPPSSTQGVEEAMEVNVPSTEGSMETATPVPSCSKTGNVSSAPLKKSAQASQVPAGSSGRGRAQPTRLTDNPRKPGHSNEAVSLKGPEVSTEEKMEEASLASDDDLLPSGAESLSSSAGSAASRACDDHDSEVMEVVVKGEEISEDFDGEEWTQILLKQRALALKSAVNTENPNTAPGTGDCLTDSPQKSAAATSSPTDGALAGD